MEEEGGGGQQASCFVVKPAVEFPQVLASIMNIIVLNAELHASKSQSCLCRSS